VVGAAVLVAGRTSGKLRQDGFRWETIPESWYTGPKMDLPEASAIDVVAI
jgi:hypothetical protein